MRNKRQKFIELAESRVNRAIKDIRLIGNLANKNSYEYSEDDARKIVRGNIRRWNILFNEFRKPRRCALIIAGIDIAQCGFEARGVLFDRFRGADLEIFVQRNTANQQGCTNISEHAVALPQFGQAILT